MPATAPPGALRSFVAPGRPKSNFALRVQADLVGPREVNVDAEKPARVRVQSRNRVMSRRVV